MGFDLNLDVMADELHSEGFTVVRTMSDVTASKATGLGEMTVYAAHSGVRIGKPNGKVKYYWGTEKQCMAVIRQTLKANQ